MRTARYIMSSSMILTMAIIFVLDAAPIANAQNDSSTTLPWGKEAEGLVIAATVDPPTTRPGQRIVLTITVRNVSNHDIEIVISNPLSDNQIELIAPDAKHTVCPLTLYGSEQDSLWGRRQTRALHPGEFNSSRIAELSRDYDMTLRGEYTITVRRLRSPGVFVVSQPLVVTIDDRK